MHRATAEPAERGLCTIDPIVVHDVRHVAHDLRRVGSSSCLRPSSGACNHVSADHEASRLTKMDDEILQPRSVAAAKFPKGIRCRAWRRVVDSPALAFGVPIAAVPNLPGFPRDVWQRRSTRHPSAGHTSSRSSPIPPPKSVGTLRRLSPRAASGAVLHVRPLSVHVGRNRVKR